jgi:flagellar basal-body rod modification protein FlgD
LAAAGAFLELGRADAAVDARKHRGPRVGGRLPIARGSAKNGQDKGPNGDLSHQFPRDNRRGSPTMCPRGRFGNDNSPGGNGFARALPPAVACVRATPLNQPLTITSLIIQVATASIGKRGSELALSIAVQDQARMTTTTIAGSTTPATASGSTANAITNATSVGNIAGNFNEFLQLLTTQLQNQNPLSPLDTNQFTQQLVQFASVEQQINMNTSLSTLISLQQTAQATSALNFLGATVVVGGNTAQLANGQATWNYAVSSPATATINVLNGSGQLVYSTTQTVQPGSQTFTWNGHSSAGAAMPSGSYTISISATGANGQSVPVTTQVQGVVTGVNVSANPPTLTINGQAYPLNQITQVLSTGSSNPVSQAVSSATSTGQNLLNGVVNAVTGNQ